MTITKKQIKRVANELRVQRRVAGTKSDAASNKNGNDNGSNNSSNAVHLHFIELPPVSCVSYRSIHPPMSVRDPCLLHSSSSIEIETMLCWNRFYLKSTIFGVQLTENGNNTIMANARIF